MRQAKLPGAGAGGNGQHPAASTQRAGATPI
jgi:hypothetical protein